MQCIECGTQIPDNSKFCSACGKSQGDRPINKEFIRDEIISQSVEERKKGIDYLFFRKAMGWYLAWILLQLAFLLIFSYGVFGGDNSDGGICDFWPLQFLDGCSVYLSEYDITEFLVYTLFPITILLIISLVRGDKSENITNKQKKQRIILADEYKYTNYLKRLIAYVFDFLILFMINTLLLMIINFDSFIYRLYDYINFDFSIANTIGIVKSPYGLALAWLYYSFFESSRFQATPGKLLMRLRVTNLSSNRISFLKATGRYWSRLITTLTLGVGYILPLFSRNRQALHDMISKCLIVEKVKKNNHNIT